MNVLMRRRWINLGLLGLVGGLVALTLLESGKEQPVIPPLLGMAVDQIQHIEVWYPDRESLAFERRDHGWRMTMPHGGWANPVLINRVLEVAVMHCSLQYSAAELNLPVLHLKPAQLRLRLNGRDIHFGATTPIEGLRYLQVGGTVHLCPDRLYPLLTSAAASFLVSATESLESPVTKAE